MTEKKKVEWNHELIGEYVVVVSEPTSLVKACRSVRKMNEIVFKMHGLQTRFARKVLKGGGDVIVRRLLARDLESVITDDPKILKEATNGKDDRK